MIIVVINIKEANVPFFKTYKKILFFSFFTFVSALKRIKLWCKPKPLMGIKNKIIL